MDIVDPCLQTLTFFIEKTSESPGEYFMVKYTY